MLGKSFGLSQDSSLVTVRDGTIASETWQMPYALKRRKQKGKTIWLPQGRRTLERPYTTQSPRGSLEGTRVRWRCMSSILNVTRNSRLSAIHPSNGSRFPTTGSRWLGGTCRPRRRRAQRILHTSTARRKREDVNLLYRLALLREWNVG